MRNMPCYSHFTSIFIIISIVCTVCIPCLRAEESTSSHDSAGSVSSLSEQAHEATAFINEREEQFALIAATEGTMKTIDAMKERNARVAAIAQKGAITGLDKHIRTVDEQISTIATQGQSEH